MEFKLPKKFNDGFNQGSPEEEDQELSPSIRASKSSPMKKFGRPAKKFFESSPLTLTKVEVENRIQKSRPAVNKQPAEQQIQARVEKGFDTFLTLLLKN